MPLREVSKIQSFFWSYVSGLVYLNEKLVIALHKDDNMLNKRSEAISKCRQRNKYMLASYDSKD